MKKKRTALKVPYDANLMLHVPLTLEKYSMTSSTILSKLGM